MKSESGGQLNIPHLAFILTPCQCRCAQFCAALDFIAVWTALIIIPLYCLLLHWTALIIIALSSTAAKYLLAKQTFETVVSIPHSCRPSQTFIKN